MKSVSSLHSDKFNCVSTKKSGEHSLFLLVYCMRLSAETSLAEQSSAEDVGPFTVRLVTEFDCILFCWVIFGMLFSFAEGLGVPTTLLSCNHQRNEPWEYMHSHHHLLLVFSGSHGRCISHINGFTYWHSDSGCKQRIVFSCKHCGTVEYLIPGGRQVKQNCSDLSMYKSAVGCEAPHHFR
jgi:hypothetical protein